MRNEQYFVGPTWHVASCGVSVVENMVIGKRLCKCPLALSLKKYMYYTGYMTIVRLGGTGNDTLT